MVECSDSNAVEGSDPNLVEDINPNAVEGSDPNSPNDGITLFLKMRAIVADYLGPSNVEPAFT